MPSTTSDKKETEEGDIMDNFMIIKQADRYFNNEMTTEERLSFEKYCHEKPEIKAQVEEHLQFLKALDDFVGRKDFKGNLQNTYEELVSKGIITEAPAKHEAKIISIFKKYKKVTAIAASIAGVTALGISILFNYRPVETNKLQQLSRDIEQIKKTQAIQYNKIAEVESKVPKGAVIKSGGSAFLIDNSGYMITNAHVLNGSGIVVSNVKGQDFKAATVYIDQSRDLAIIKITDKDFKTLKSLPYHIRRNKLDLGQDIFTLGYPRNSIVYNTGYVSAATGANDDTSTIQLSMIANPGNSGGPVFNSYGAVVGVISTRETKAEGVSYAIKANEIHQTIEDWERTDSTAKLKISDSKISGNKHKLTRTEQIKNLQNYVYLVKVY